jgi:hypothetical protein
MFQVLHRVSTLTALSVFFLLITSPCAHLLAAEEVAWSAFDGQRFEIYLAEMENGQVRNKIQITNDQFNNLHPSMVRRANGELWLAWTAMDNKVNKLFYAHKTDGSWTYPREIETGLQSSIAPFLGLDSKDTVWATWAGFNGKNDDIYVSHWTGRNWSAPVRIHPANDVPDILPELSLENGHLTVTWQTFDGDRYQYVQSVFNGHTWSEPLPITETKQENIQTKILKMKKMQKELPADIKAVGKAAILTR